MTTPTPMPLGVPAAQVGPLTLNAAGADMLAWEHTPAGNQNQNHPGVYALDSDGNLSLAIDGQNASFCQVWGPGTGPDGIYEARVFLPDDGHGAIADWPAWWLYGGNQADELDIIEGLGGRSAAHLWWNGGNAGLGWSTIGPGWHTGTAVITATSVTVYIDGKQLGTYARNPLVTQLHVIHDIMGARTGQAAVPATYLAEYTRVWQLAPVPVPVTTYTEFIDVTGANAGNAPLVSGGYRAYYNTGTGGVPASPAQIAAAQAAGMHVLLYDQSPGLWSFAAGHSHMADVEQFAGTITAVDAAIIARRALGLTTHTVYCSFSQLPAVKASITDRTGVWFGVADYAWSIALSQSLLAANPDWGYVQFGDPNSNPGTLVPGTSVNLAMAHADINVAKNAWLTAVLGATPAPPPAPPAAPVWPFGPFDYLGTPRPDVHCHSGYSSSTDHHVVAVFQQRMRDRGWTITVDGYDGLNQLPVNQGQMPAVVAAFQAEKGLTVDHLVGPKTWAAAWTAPVTP